MFATLVAHHACQSSCDDNRAVRRPRRILLHSALAHACRNRVGVPRLRLHAGGRTSPQSIRSRFGCSGRHQSRRYVGYGGFKPLAPACGIQSTHRTVRNLACRHMDGGARDGCTTPTIASGNTEKQDDLEIWEQIYHFPGPTGPARPLRRGRSAVLHTGNRERHHVPVHDIAPVDSVARIRLAAVPRGPVVVVQAKKARPACRFGLGGRLSSSTSMRALIPPVSGSTYEISPRRRPPSPLNRLCYRGISAIVARRNSTAVLQTSAVGGRTISNLLTEVPTTASPDRTKTEQLP